MPKQAQVAGASVRRHSGPSRRAREGASTPLLFSYRKLQQEGLKRSTFGRPLNGEAAALVAYSGRDADRVSGAAFKIADAEPAAQSSPNIARNSPARRKAISLTRANVRMTGTRAATPRPARGARPPRLTGEL